MRQKFYFCPSSFFPVLDHTLTEQLQAILNSIPGFRPEVGLAAAFLVIILIDLMLTGSLAQFRAGSILFTLTFLILAFTAFVSAEALHQPTVFLFSGFLINDGLAVFCKLLFLLVAALTLLHARSLRKSYPSLFTGEFFALLMAMLLGLFLMVMSANLLLVYLSIELVSLSSYVLTTFQGNAKGAEGGLKYLLFGAMSSGVMLYGMSLLYGFTGSLQFADPAFLSALSQIPLLPLMLAGLLTVSGLLFKISAIPFHFWTPDVYEAGPTPVVSFFSVAPKAAALIILLRFLMHFPEVLVPIVAVLALGSMIIGNFSALGQSDGKRMLAYSSIAHAGFMLVGVVASNQLGQQSLAFYLGTYLFMSTAAFLLLDLAAHQWAEKEDHNRYAMDRLKGLGLQRPFLGVVLLLVMVALTGLPPTAGFSAKLFIFSSLWQAYQTSGSALLLGLFIAGLLNALVSLFYYLKIPFLMFFRPADDSLGLPAELTAFQKVLTVGVVIPVLLFFFKADWLMNWIAGLRLFGK